MNEHIEKGPASLRTCFLRDIRLMVSKNVGVQGFQIARAL